MNNYNPYLEGSTIGAECAKTMLGWAQRPCPSQQPVQLPLDYVCEGERAKGVAACAGGTLAVGVAALAAVFFAKIFND